MSTKIYYFSGTGNSLHVSRILANMLPDCTLTPIIGTLKSAKRETRADAVGLVFPIYAFSIPEPVKQFLLSRKLPSASYIFAISTRKCSSKVFRYVNKILSKNWQSLDAYFSVEMAENYLPVFKMPSNDEIFHLEEKMLTKMESIKKDIVSGKKNRPKDSLLVTLFANTLFPLLTFLHHKTHYFNIDQSFFAEATCNGCKVCEEVCLGERIRMKDDKPEWDNTKECTFCFSCIQYCPCQAIQIRNRRTDRKGRYHHPEVTYKDIANQKVAAV